MYVVLCLAAPLRSTKPTCCRYGKEHELKIVSPQVRIFPHSREEFPSEDSLTMWLLNGLRGRGGLYHLRSADAVADLPRGSVVLFRYGQRIVGEGVIWKEKIKKKERIRSLSGQEVEYGAQITFAPSSIRIYSPPLPVRRLQRHVNKLPKKKDISNARPYYELGWNIYASVLKEVVSGGVFLS